MITTFLLQFQEACDDVADHRSSGTETRSRETGDQRQASFVAGTKTGDGDREKPDHSQQRAYLTFGVGTETKSRETGDQHRTHAAYRTFGA